VFCLGTADVKGKMEVPKFAKLFRFTGLEIRDTKSSDFYCKRHILAWIHVVLREDRSSHFTTFTLTSSVLLVPVMRRTMHNGDQAFAVAGPRAWNNLPDFITDCSSLRTFKQYLETYLFILSF